MSSPARPPETCSPWAWSHQPISIPHSTECWGGSHQQYDQLQPGQIQLLYSIWASHTLVVEIKSLSFYSRISKARVQDIWNHSFFTLKTAANSPTPSGTSSKQFKPFLEANETHTNSQRWQGRLPPFSHPATNRGGAAVFRTNIEALFTFWTLSPDETLIKTTYSTAEILWEK